MRAAALRKQPDGWDIPTIEDDAETRVYFTPDPEPELLPALDALPPVRMSLPIDVPPVVRLQPMPPPLPPRPVYVALPPPPPPLPRPIYVAPRPQAIPMIPMIPMTYARRPAPASLDAQMTARVRRQPADARRTALLALAGACVMVWLMIGGAIALRGSHAPQASASVVTALAPAPVAVHVVAAPAPARALAVTPIETAPAPVADHRNVIIVSEEPPLAPAPQPVQAVAPALRTHRSHHTVAAPLVIAHAAPAPVAAPVAATGTLELSTKPPCEIVIDGKSTGFTTPRKGIAVAAGRHEVTLTNADEGIQLTTEVVVTAGHATRMIRDFTK